MKIMHIQHKLSKDWFVDLEDLQNDMLLEEPCIAFMALTYPAGNTGYFFATACGDRYACVTIGKPAYEIVMGAMSDGQPGLDT